MSKLRKSVMMLGVLLASSAAFVSCNDDNEFPENTLGATFIQQITAYTTSVNLRWTITPTDNVEGYQIDIYEGSRDNMGTTVVATGTFGKKVATGTFTGLTPNTTYTVASQCIPADGSGFTDADVAYFQFTTAPVLTVTSATISDIEQMVSELTGALLYNTEIVYDDNGDPVEVQKTDENGDPVYDDDGEPVMVYETKEVPIYQATLTFSYSPEMTIQELAGIYIYLEDENEKVLLSSILESIPDNTTDMPNPISITIEDITPGAECYLEIFPAPSDYTYYTTSSANWSDIYTVTIPTVDD